MGAELSLGLKVGDKVGWKVGCTEIDGSEVAVGSKLTEGDSDGSKLALGVVDG